MVEDLSAQRISRLTPIEAVLARIDAQIEAVKPQRWNVAATLGYTLAENVVASQQPEHPIGLRDGFAVEAAAIADAGSYAPVPLPSPIRRIDLGESMPDGTDAVLPLDAVVFRGEQAEAVASVAPGEGVLLAGGDAAPGALLRHAGERMRSIDIVAAQAAGIKGVLVREPRIAVVLGVEPVIPLGGVPGLLVRSVFEAGATVSNKPKMTLDVAVADSENDAIVAFGGTGSGRHDNAVQELARLGRVEIHGIAISPGQTTALGFAGARPVLLVSGRLDAALAAWHLIGRGIVAKLAGGRIYDRTIMLPLKRKVASAIGMTEFIPVSCKDDMAEPLASGYLSFVSLTRSDGWIVVPADSEGYAAGTPVAVKPWP
ncbi:MAG: molybdopterin-binding protein [Xanthobacteraceae bacterium]